ncbi:processed acidic surface protein [Alkalihalophilus lindianensis]|uniref:Processed acidic surface protein n=1 Tax=Alkalihalophilus lindianensis TaxID=1630542 RepID=A0ABU3X9C9_9BACI|nr:processed acidic surface protein [Alkalihalophilus lindianensis]MDV2684488.1 processed acidic surface protein [Alkalihalophilus lindianensis]
MKRLLSMLVAVALLLTVLPVSTFALDANDASFNKFLRGIGWDKQDYIDYLESKDWSLEDFDDVEWLGTPLSENSVTKVLQQYDLTRDELNQLFIDHGDIEEGEDILASEWIIFEEELESYVDFYLNDDWGTPITEENLQELLNEYGFANKEELESFLNEYGESIEDFEYIEDLDWTIYWYLYEYDDFDLYDDLEGLFSEIGLTSDELKRLIDHFMSLDLENPNFLDRLEALNDRLMAIPDFESASELSAEEIAELLSIFDEMLDLFQLDVKYYLVKGDEKKSISFGTLMTMDSTNGYDLLIELYNKQGEFLADILLTADMFGSDLIKNTGGDLKEVEKAIAKPQAQPKKEVEKVATAPVKTVKGGRLPDTATDYANNMLFGLGALLAGVILFRRRKAVMK